MTSAPADMVERQLCAYNARDLDAFVRCFASDVEVANQGAPPHVRGREAFRSRYATLFERHPENYVEILHRSVGEGWVVDEELVHRDGIDAAGRRPGILHVSAVYEVGRGPIRRVCFAGDDWQALPTAEEVLAFWFGRGPSEARVPRPEWFSADTAFDALVSARFRFLHRACARGRMSSWLSAPRSCLAYILVLDQFSRHLHRGHAAAFAWDELARQAAHHAVRAGFDAALAPVERWFLYMPFLHSESLADQELSVALFERLADQDPRVDDRECALRYRDVIRRFGRFPHRNVVLGRPSTSEEAALGGPRAAQGVGRVTTRFSRLVEGHFADLLAEYVDAPCFRATPAVYPRHPWHRPLALPGPLAELAEDVSLEELESSRSLCLQRVLLNVYEQDLAYLDEGLGDDGGRALFDSYYGAELVALGKTLRPVLERAAFGFLEKAAPRHWSSDAARLVRHLNEVVDECDRDEVGTARFLLDSPSSDVAARALLVQIAPDALSEASAMGRTLLGVFGEEQSALMRVFMDEYGLGAHADKHGTLYEEIMTTSGLRKESHYYYHYYLPTSLLMTNYFHYLCCHRAHWFRYLGALFYLEATMPHFATQLSPVLKRCLGAQVNTSYFDEHAHIDPHHKRLVLDNLVVASIRKYGERILDDLYHGFEAIRVVQRVADEDYRRQVAFALDVARVPETDRDPPPRSLPSGRILTEPRIGAMEDTDLWVTVLEGQATFDAVGFAPERIGPGRRLRLGKGRVYSLFDTSPDFRACGSVEA
jgi:uncharacterized protein (DUF924 family)